MDPNSVRACLDALSGALILADTPERLAELPPLLDRLERAAADLDAGLDVAHRDRLFAHAREVLAGLLRAPADDQARWAEEATDAVAALQDVLWFSAPRSGSSSAAPPAGGRGGGRQERTAVPFADDPELGQEFLVEAAEHIDRIESHVLVLQKDPQDPEALAALFRAFHTIKGVSVHLDLEEISSLAHDAESLLDAVRGGRRPWDEQVAELVFAAGDAMRELLDRLRQGLQEGRPPEPLTRLPGLLERVRRAAERPEGSGAGPVGRGGVDGGGVDRGAFDGAAGVDAEDGVEGEESVGGSPEARPGSRARLHRIRETMRVDSRRLDRLVETVGELVTAVSVLRQGAGPTDEAFGDGSLQAVEKITRELQDIGTSLRMVPLRSTFRRVERWVHDLSREFGKEVVLDLSGGDTELDKGLVERLADPLLHLIRNAIDHGIEPDTAARVRAGKPARARIGLRAYHQGGSIHLEVEDDGRGIDRAKVLERARAAGLASPGAGREIDDLIFQPGVSTASSVTAVSGRGVGMDVVRRGIEEMRGSIDVVSEKGRGTLFVIRLPLTVAIVDGMVVGVGRERYLMPTLGIVRSVRPRAGEVTRVLGRSEMLEVEGTLTPLYRLHDLLCVEDAETDPERGIVVVVEQDGENAAFLVDTLVGQQQAVIKSIDRELGAAPGISGAAVMADGRVGLILDLAGLIQSARAGRPVVVGATA